MRKTKCFTMFDQMFDGVQILSNTTKHDQTRSNNTKQGVQTGKCLVTKQCLIALVAKHFPFGQGLSLKRCKIWRILGIRNAVVRGEVKARAFYYVNKRCLMTSH